MNNKTNRRAFNVKPASGYLSDRLGDVGTAAYALVTGPWWLNMIAGTVTLPEVAYLVFSTILLMALWGSIAIVKGKLDLS